jgi:hypothetical protein
LGLAEYSMYSPPLCWLIDIDPKEDFDDDEEAFFEE